MIWLKLAWDKTKTCETRPAASSSGSSCRRLLGQGRRAGLNPKKGLSPCEPCNA